MRVLLVTAAASTTGGGERHVADLVSRLLDHGVEVTLVAPPEGDLAELALAYGIPFHGIDLSAGLRPGRMTALRRAIVSSAPDVVHAHGSRAAFFTRLADPMAEQRVVYTFHGIHIDKAGSSARQTALLKAERRLVEKTARFITVSASDEESGAELGILDPARTDVVHNGIDPISLPEPGAFRREFGLSAETPLVLHVGRFDTPKNHRTLLDAWLRVADERPDARLVLIGSGPLEGAIRERRRALHLEESVIIAAPRPDITPAYADADMFVLPSLWEGFPYVILEAMSAGLPIVATEVNGIPEAIESGRTGLLVPPSNHYALADALVGLLGDSGRCRELGAAARQVVTSRFTLEAMTTGTLATYSKVTGA